MNESRNCPGVTVPEGVRQPADVTYDQGLPGRYPRAARTTRGEVWPGRKTARGGFRPGYAETATGGSS